MVSWILVYSFLGAPHPYLNKPIIMDNFTTREACKLALEHINNTYLEAGIIGRGYCWGEEK